MQVAASRDKQIRMLVILAAVTLEKLLLLDNADGEAIWPTVERENLLQTGGEEGEKSRVEILASERISVSERGRPSERFKTMRTRASEFFEGLAVDARPG